MGDPCGTLLTVTRLTLRRLLALLVTTMLLLSGLFGSFPVRAAGNHIPVQILSSSATTHRMIALTFDDGPSLFTPQVLAVLAHFHAHATFFLVGQHVAQYPATVKQEVDAGNQLGNHTYNHLDVEGLPTAFVVDQLATTQNAARSASGTTPRWFRPPYGLGDLRVATIASSLGLRTILWSVDPRDWSRPGAAAIAVRVLSMVRPGSVVVMHDGGGDRSQTIAALAVILATLQAQGYIFATLDELFGLTPPPSCSALQEQQAYHWFSAAGQTAHPEDLIYRTWRSMYCDGQNLGPATGREYQLSPRILGQDFARTGHRLEWDVRTQSSRVTLVWSWAIAAFRARGVQPAWHTPITEAWFTQFFGGYNRGAALTPAHSEVTLHGTVQCFESGCAFAPRRGPVLWQGSKARRGRHYDQRW